MSFHDLSNASLENTNAPLSDVHTEIRNAYLQEGFRSVTVVKNLPAKETQETWVQSLGQEDPLE